MFRVAVTFAAGIFVAIGPAASHGQDDLNRVLERDRLVAQKLKADANDAIDLSRRLERSDANLAMEHLLEVTAKVRNAPELPAEERTRLVQRLQARQRELIAAVQQQKRAKDDEAVRRAEQRAQQEARPQPAKKGNAADQGPAAIASKIFEQRNAQIGANNKQKAEVAERNLGTLASLPRGATQIEGDIQFSKDWARIAERGKQKLTEKEKNMLRALNSTLSVNFDKTPFSEVISQLQDKASVSILVDETAIKDVNLDYMDPVSLRVNKATLRIILQKVLKDRGLSYVLKDGIVQVVTLQKAREMMVVRAYPIGDLVAAENPLFWGPVFSRAIMLQNAQRVIDMITGSIEPSSWSTNGGPATITFQEATQSLVIRASAEMHFMLGGSGMTSR